MRELLSTEPFQSLADLTAALKERLARLKIPASPQDITEAYRVVDSNRPLLGAVAAGPSRQERPPEAPVIGRAEALALCQQLGLRARRMPAVTETRRAGDRRRALRLVAREIEASIERGEALEQSTDGVREGDAPWPGPSGSS